MFAEQALSITGVVQIDAAFVVGNTGSFTLETVQVILTLLAQFGVFSL